MTAGALAAFLSSMPAIAREAWGGEEGDLDGDGALNLEQFRAGPSARPRLADRDTDNEGLLSEEEFGGAIYGRYDVDPPDAIEETEYSASKRDLGEEDLWADDEKVVEAGIGEVEEIDAVDREGLVEDEGLVDEEDGLGREMAGPEVWDVDSDGVLLRDECKDGFRE